MNSPGATLAYDFQRKRSRQRQAVELRDGAEGEGTRASRAGSTSGRLPRVTRLLALAHRFDDLLARGEVASMAELARAGRVTRARLSQIMDLTLLAPDIQEAVLAFGPVETGRDQVTMRVLLDIVRAPYWPDQRRLWREHEEAGR